MLVEIKYTTLPTAEKNCKNCEGSNLDCKFKDHLKEMTGLEYCNKYSPSTEYSTFKTNSPEFHKEILEIIKKYS